MTEPVRLSKRVAELAGCSRRDAELYIEGGWVQVDGRMVDEPFFRVRDETVVLHPDAIAQPAEPVTLLLNKPEGYRTLGGDHPAAALLVADARHDDGRPGISPLYRHLQRQMPVTPLETGASGLVVFTQDGRVRRRLEEDNALIEQEILVDVAGNPSAGALAELAQGLWMDGYRAPPMKVSRQSELRLRFALKDYQPGLIPDACEQVGLEVTAMRRLRIGRVSLAGLPVGQWRYLGTQERF